MAVISDGGEDAAYQLARELGIVLVLQGGAIEHHASAWGFLELLNDPQRGDRRFAQWFQDGSYEAPGIADPSFGIRACPSRYAKAVYELRRERDAARAKRIAEACRSFPDVIVGCSGPIECEMHNGPDRWGDYSPYTIAEFRDYLTHRGLYASGAEREGLGYPGGEGFADDASPAQARGDHPCFNETFGTSFATWEVRYWDAERFPERLPLEAYPMPQAGEQGHIAGGFDAPRVWPGRAAETGAVAEGNARFWEAWAAVEGPAPGFRSKLLNFWIRDHTRWLQEAGMPRERIYSHQIPGESYGLGRLSTGASAVWTADTPHGSIGITTYFGAASDVDVFGRIVGLNPNWGIFEYHPHPINALEAPPDEYLHSLNTCLRFRAHILTPISWTDDGKDFIVKTGPFAEAIRQVLTSLPDQPYYSQAYVAYAPPAVSDVAVRAEGGRRRVTWSSRIWPDLPHQWSDWRDFGHFEVRSGEGKVLAQTGEAAATADGERGKLTVVAVRRGERPLLPAVSGVAGHRGMARWDECWDFFCDHYVVEVLAGPEARKPIVTAQTRRAAYRVPGSGERREVWCRVAAADGEGRTGPLSSPVRVPLPRPGRQLASLAERPAVVRDSPDTRTTSLTLGGAALPTLYQHPPLQGGGWARAEYRLALPQAKAGQRIILDAEVALPPAEPPSDGVTFAVEVDGQARQSLAVEPGETWHPFEADLTAEAGRDILLALMTNAGGHSANDAAHWGDPRVLLVGPGVRELPQVVGVAAEGKFTRGRVALRWDDRASDGALWRGMAGFSGFRVYRGPDRDFAVAEGGRLGESRTSSFTDETFGGRETFYRVTAVLADGAESPPSEAVQYAP